MFLLAKIHPSTFLGHFLIFHQTSPKSFHFLFEKYVGGWLGIEKILFSLNPQWTPTQPPANSQHNFRKKWNFFWLVWWKMRKCPKNVLVCILASKSIILVIPNKQMDVGFTIASILSILCLRLCSYWHGPLCSEDVVLWSSEVPIFASFPRRRWSCSRI